MELSEGLEGSPQSTGLNMSLRNPKVYFFLALLESAYSRLWQIRLSCHRLVVLLVQGSVRRPCVTRIGGIGNMDTVSWNVHLLEKLANMFSHALSAQ